MKKIVTLCVFLLGALSAEAGNGFYVGAGVACQFVPNLGGTHFAVAPAVDLGFKSDYLMVGGMASFDGDIMLSVDVNSRLELVENVNMFLGGGYGTIYRKSEYVVNNEIYKSSGYVSWPHANIGMEFGFNDNVGLHLIGAFGYSRCPNYYDVHGYRYDYYHDNNNNWRIAAQVRASIVWTF
ncbi:MAG: hypothetical protein IJS88_01900 [Alphaproteobacteria bacterium]|nr:hypothetical protein [Alphaproteobacteria bacterium]